jgi:hypothetical protein
MSESMVDGQLRTWNKTRTLVMIGQPQRSANLMSDPARMDFAEHRLRTFIGQLDACETIEERDQALKEMIWEATDILVKRPDLLRRWLLGLDRINRRFMLMKQHVTAWPEECRPGPSTEDRSASKFSPEPVDAPQSAS